LAVTITAPASIWSVPLRPVTVALITTIALSAFEGLAVAAAIPDITAELGQVSLTPWVLTGYFISSTVATLAVGPVVDQAGVRRTFELSLLVFVGASVGCAVAPSMPALVAARVVQGLGGGALISVALAAVGLIYPEQLRARQYAAQSAVWGSMSVIGPAAAAVFIATTGWSGVFWVNLPVGAWAWYLARRSLPSTNPGRSATPTRRSVDIGGLVLATAFISLLIAALSTVSIRTAFLGAATAAVGAIWWVHAGRTTEPLLQRPHVAANPFRLIGLTIASGMAAAVALNLYLPIVVRGSLGRSEAAAAFSLVFFSVAWTIAAQVTSRLLDHFAGPSVAIGGFVVLLVGTGWGALLGTDPRYWELAATSALRGLGIGSASIPYLTELQRRAEGRDFGRINAAHQFFRFLGLIVSIAVVGAIVFFVVGRDTGDVDGLQALLAGETTGNDSELSVALASGYRWAQASMAVVAAVGLGLAVTTRNWLRSHRQSPSNLI
jgi:MFS family permease